MKLNKRRKLTFFSAFIFMVFIVLGAGLLLNSGKLKHLKQSITKNTAFPPQFEMLFKNFELNNLVVKTTYYSIGRNPVTQFIYKHKVSIVVQELAINPDSPLNQIVLYDNENSAMSKKLSYFGFGVNGYRYYHTIDSLISTSNCIVSCIGDSIKKTVLAHNLIIISYFMKRFSLKYSNLLGPNIVAEVPSFFWGKVNIEVAFLKRGGKVFLMLFSSDTMENRFDQNLPLIILNLE